MSDCFEERYENWKLENNDVSGFILPPEYIRAEKCPYEYYKSAVIDKVICSSKGYHNFPILCPDYRNKNICWVVLMKNIKENSK